MRAITRRSLLQTMGAGAADTAFARTGNPSIDGLAWDAYDSQNHNTVMDCSS